MLELWFCRVDAVTQQHRRPTAHPHQERSPCSVWGRRSSVVCCACSVSCCPLVLVTCEVAAPSPRHPAPIRVRRDRFGRASAAVAWIIPFGFDGSPQSAQIERRLTAAGEVQDRQLAADRYFDELARIFSSQNLLTQVAMASPVMTVSRHTRSNLRHSATGVVESAIRPLRSAHRQAGPIRPFEDCRDCGPGRFGPSR